jgi:Raf kinase inhibitor-like YbhB/YbcL family protein
VDDPEGFNWVHWVIFNLPPDISQLTENVKAIVKLDNGALQGSNSFGSIGYRGPCPPSSHHYYFTIYAMDSILDVRAGTTKTVVSNAMDGHILGKAMLMGVFP